MISLIQRVNFASVSVDNQTIAKIDHGILALVGVEKTDTQENVTALFNKIRKFRIFTDDNDKTNLSIEDIKGDILLVPQFTLPANTKKGNRPGFDPVANPELGEKYFNKLVEMFTLKTNLNVQKGIFQAYMKVQLENDGPMTFWLQK